MLVTRLPAPWVFWGSERRSPFYRPVGLFFRSFRCSGGGPGYTCALFYSFCATSPSSKLRGKTDHGGSGSRPLPSLHFLQQFHRDTLREIHVNDTKNKYKSIRPRELPRYTSKRGRSFTTTSSEVWIVPVLPVLDCGGSHFRESSPRRTGVTSNSERYRMANTLI